MKDQGKRSYRFSRLQRQWANVRHKFGFAPRPSKREEIVDSIDPGFRLMADVRVFSDDSGNEHFVIDLMDKEDMYSTVALLRCYDCEAVVSILLESELVINRYKNSTPIEEWGDD